jgi:hypothetical protein
MMCKYGRNRRGNDENQQQYGTYNFFQKKKHNFKLKSNELHQRLHHGDPWRKKRSKEKKPKSYDVWIKITYFGANKGQPTPCPLPAHFKT